MTEIQSEVYNAGWKSKVQNIKPGKGSHVKRRKLNGNHSVIS